MAKKRSSEAFGKLRNQKPSPSERFGTLPNSSEKTSEHILTVREAAKRFENAGVPRTERSIINWCRPNPQGIPRLDCFYDTNERKYYITPSSVNAVIGEERNKLKIQPQNGVSEPEPSLSENAGNVSEGFGNRPNSFGSLPNDAEGRSELGSWDNSQSLATQNRLLQIEVRAKDMYINLLEKNQAKLFEDIKTTSNLLGVMKERVRQLEAPKRQESTEPEPDAEQTDQQSTQLTPYEVIDRAEPGSAQPTDDSIDDEPERSSLGMQESAENDDESGEDFREGNE